MNALPFMAMALLAGADAEAGSARPEDPDLAPLTVAVGPLDGAEAATADVLLEALRALTGLTVVDLRGLAQTLGPSALARWQACATDGCRVQEASSLAWDRLLVGEIAAPRTLRLRLLSRDPSDGPRVRVSREVGSAGLEAALRDATIELFPMRAARSPIAVIVEGLPRRASVRVDALEPVALAGEEGRFATRLAPGPHALEARAPGHDPWRTTVEVRAGAPLRVAADLPKRRSPLPLYLGAGALVLGAVGGALAVSAQSRADAWTDACPDQRACASGFTRSRYLGDEDALERERWGAGALFAVGGAALVGALVAFLLDPGLDGPDSSFGVVEAER